MNSSVRKSLCTVAVCLLVAALAPRPAAALHSVFLAVPGHSEEALTWCGPAVAQMAMEGYPAGSCSHLQADIWASVVSHKVEPAWDTDPVGMRETLKGLCPPPGSWSVVARAAEADLMYAIAFWMTTNNFPVAVVLDTASHRAAVPAHREHWVVIKGIVTDVTPVGNPAVTLEHIWYTDPSPAAFGDPPIESFIPGGVWSTLLQPVALPGSAYDGEHVAVIEPPEIRGRLRTRPTVLTGKVLPIERVRELAVRWVEKIEPLRELEPFKALADGRPLEPMLVDPSYGGYYLVPFATGDEAAGYAVLINAYSGDFQGAGRFAPERYLSEKEAVEHAQRFLGERRQERFAATRVYAPEAGSASLFHPVWRVQAGDRTVAVGRRGNVREWPAARKEPGTPRQ